MYAADPKIAQDANWILERELRHSYDAISALRLNADELLSQLKPDVYPFHNKHHTLDDVLPYGIVLAARHGLPERDLKVLAAGLLLHDTGFLQQYRENEEIGACMARDLLPAYGFSSEQIDQVGGIILATRMPQKPSTLLEKIMCDADLNNLGRDSFWSAGEALYRELLLHTGDINYAPLPSRDIGGWYKRQRDFLESHRFHTEYGKRELEQGKQNNIRHIEKLLALVR
jgi:uncharacterized protein